jgi:hypothetical protein
MRFIHCFALFTCLFVAGCAASIPVETDYDPGQDFSSLRNYAWHDQARAPSPLVADRIRGAIETRLAARGYARVEPDAEPDFRVSFTAVAEQALRVDEMSSRLGYSNRRWGVGVSSRTRLREYTRGTLIVDVIDATGKDLLWRGVSARALGEGRSPEERAGEVMEIVTAILRQFPPTPE